ncbi:MAG: penicillin-binding protein 2 [Lachnospiraceae bacterium]|nr:penicillin-binding protein 2 [Lachnospiraceae bacterium]
MKLFRKYMKKKLALTFFLVALVLIGLAVSVGFIGKEKGEEYGQRVLTQQTVSSGTIPFKRGQITDRNGTILAANEAVYNLILDPSVIGSHENILGPTLDLLVECYGYDREELEKLVKDQPTSQYIRYEKRMSEEKRDQFLTRKEEINNNLEIKDKIEGVWFETEYKRIYPYSTLACDLIGFASRDGASGSYGIEEYYNEELAGTSGRTYRYINEESDAEQVTRDAIDGNTIVSTIDVNLQSIVEAQIKQFNEEIGSKNTAVVVINPNNGEILAMASYPYYDLNNPMDLNISGYYTQEELDAMDDEEKSQELAELWANYVTQSLYEPGSTAKPLTIAAGLEEGKLSPANTYLCDGGWDYGEGKRINCHRLAGHGTLDLEGAIVESCNDALIQIGQQIGTEIFCKYQPVFGLGTRTGIDLPGEEDGILKKEEEMSEIDLVTNSFGQNFDATVIQMAAAHCSLINGGHYYKPHVVKEILRPDGSVVESVDKTLVRETISETTSDFLKTAMTAMVDEQRPWSTAIPGYEIGGKTGTAEKLPRKDKKYVVSFASFLPASDPEYFMMVVIDEPNVEDQSTGGHATNLTRSLWEAIIPYLNLFPTRDTGEQPSQTETPEEPANGTPPAGAENPAGGEPSGEENQTGVEPPGAGNQEGGEAPAEAGHPENGNPPAGENQGVEGNPGEGNQTGGEPAEGEGSPEGENLSGEGNPGEEPPSENGAYSNGIFQGDFE